MQHKLLTVSEVAARLQCHPHTIRRWIWNRELRAGMRRDGDFLRLWARGQPIGENDLWIAATALEHGLILVTSDAHFGAIEELEMESWAAT